MTPKRGETTTPKEIQELRDWAAGKMGWKTATVKVMDSREVDNAWAEQVGPENIIYHWKKHWQPDNPSTGQIWMLVDRMREFWFNLDLSSFHNSGWWQARFTKFDTDRIGPSQDWMGSKESPCLAILLAARATEGQG